MIFSRLATFSSQEAHIIRNDSPEGRTSVYLYRKQAGGEWVNYNAVISKQIVLLKLFRWPSVGQTLLDDRVLASLDILMIIDLIL